MNLLTWTPYCKGCKYSTAPPDESQHASLCCHLYLMCKHKPGSSRHHQFSDKVLSFLILFLQQSLIQHPTLQDDFLTLLLGCGCSFLFSMEYFQAPWLYLCPHCVLWCVLVLESQVFGHVATLHLDSVGPCCPLVAPRQLGRRPPPTLWLIAAFSSCIHCLCFMCSLYPNTVHLCIWSP